MFPLGASREHCPVVSHQQLCGEQHTSLPLLQKLLPQAISPLKALYKWGHFCRNTPAATNWSFLKDFSLQIIPHLSSHLHWSAPSEIFPLSRWHWQPARCTQLHLTLPQAYGFLVSCSSWCWGWSSFPTQGLQAKTEAQVQQTLHTVRGYDREMNKAEQQMHGRHRDWFPKSWQKARRGDCKKQRCSRDMQGEIRVVADTEKVICEAVAGFERKA